MRQSRARATRLDDRQNVRLAENEVLISLDGDLGATVLPVEHLVADLHFHRNSLVLLEAARSNGDDLALLRLFLGGIGDVETTTHRFRLFQRLHYDTIGERTDLQRCRALSSHESRFSFSCEFDLAAERITAGTHHGRVLTRVR